MGFFDDAFDFIMPGLGSQLIRGTDDPKATPGARFYVKDGQVYRSDAPENQQTPVPLSNIPGTTAEPSQQYYTMADQVRSIQNLLPGYTKSVTDQLGSVAQAELESSKATSPGYEQLMTDLYREYGPQLNKIGSDIAKQNALAQAEQDNAVLAGPGGNLVKQAYDLSQVYDKPFYDTRAATAGRIGDLLSSIDLSGKLSPTERDEIEKSLALQGGRRGTYNAPSNTDTVSNAMQYGEAGRSRITQSQDALSKAIAASSAFLPAAKSGVDVFQVATGRPSMPNTGNSQFQPLNNTAQAGAAASGLASNLLGTSNANASNATQTAINQANINANKKDWLDKFVQITQGIGNLGSLAGGVGGCWVAREVYGKHDFRWMLFRNWLSTDAPTWLLSLYNKRGERFAVFISNKPLLKFVIRKLMDTRIKRYY